MPSGPVHVATTTMLLVTSGIYATGFMESNSDYACISIGIAVSYILNPDLDLNWGSPATKLLNKIPLIGWLLSKIWYWLWRPYALIMPHRSTLSHFPFISTFVRILYLALFTLPFRLVWPFGWRESTFLLVGLVLSDITHWLMDKAGPREYE